MRFLLLAVSAVLVLSGCPSNGNSDGGNGGGGSTGGGSATGGGTSSGGGTATGGGTGTGGGTSTGGGTATGGGGTSTGGGTGTGGGGSATGGGGGGTTFDGGLIGTWLLTTTPTGGTAVQSTIVIGSNSLDVTSPSFSFTATRSGNTETYVDNAGATHVTVNAVQSTSGPFDPGVIPFDLGGTWTITGGDTDAGVTVTCTGSISATEIDATCTDPDPLDTVFNFSFTTAKGGSLPSITGDFGGIWTNTWQWTSDAGTMTTDTCLLQFQGQNVATCTSGNSILANITFTMNQAGTMASGTTSGADFAAQKQ